MLKVMKYEFFKKQRLFLIALIIMTVIEGVIAFSLLKGRSWTILAFFLSFALIYGSLIFVFIDSVLSYSTDLSHKSGYSLFLTPTSGYKIIAAKSLISFIELILVIALVFGFMVINLKIIDVIYYDRLSALTKEMLTAFKDINLIPKLHEIIVMVFVFCLEWFDMILIAILSITLRKTLLSNMKYGWIISVLFFIGIYSVVGSISMAVIIPLGYFRDIGNLINQNMEAPDFSQFNYIKYLIASLCLYAVYIPTFFFFSGKLLNKRVDL